MPYVRHASHDSRIIRLQVVSKVFVSPGPRQRVRAVLAAATTTGTQMIEGSAGERCPRSSQPGGAGCERSADYWHFGSASTVAGETALTPTKMAQVLVVAE